ncbi:MAG: hypothetical protein J07HR59_00741, partial [Halorubrum sp. J07HR59]
MIGPGKRVQWTPGSHVYTVSSRACSAGSARSSLPNHGYPGWCIDS